MSFLVGTLIAIAVGTVLYTGHKAGSEANEEEKLRGSYSNYMSKRDSLGMSDTETVEAVTDMWMRGEISDEEYKIFSEYYEIYEDAQTRDEDESWWEHQWDKSKAFWNGSEKKRETCAKIYDKIVTDSPAAKELAQNLSKGFSEALNKDIPWQTSIAAPEYLDTQFENKEFEPTPMKLWSGQELADIHNIDFDPNNYYDLIKQSTEAGVKYGEHRAGQLDAASDIGEAASRVSYLDSIRNNKAQAIASGASLGQRMANDILANKTAIDTYAANKADTANQKLNVMTDVLAQDAQAAITARQYYESLAGQLASVSTQLYNQDALRYEQDQKSAAAFYNADMILRGQRGLANAQMEADKRVTDAVVNAANNTLTGKRDTYSWIFERMLEKNDYDYNKAWYDTRDLIFQSNSGMVPNVYISNKS